MATHPYLAFCPYLPLGAAIEFAGWKLGPIDAFDGQWAEPGFRGRAAAFLGKFVDAVGTPIKRPVLLGRAGAALDGAMPSAEERDALQAALDFAVLDGNPRYSHGVKTQAWSVATSDNPDLFFWPIDVEGGHVTVETGGLVRTLTGGFTIDDPSLQIRSPLELHIPAGVNIDVECLEAVYQVCLQSARSPGASHDADRLRTAIRWLEKAWRNTASIGMEDRVVSVKTAFEALTGTSKSRESARRLKSLFESLAGTLSGDADVLLWSPAEHPRHSHTYKGQTELLTDLEDWFMAFADARNSIIHDGIVPPLTYAQVGSAYEGPLFNVGEFVLRSAIKTSLSRLGYPDIWRSPSWRAVRKAVEDFKRQAISAAAAEINND